MIKAFEDGSIIAVGMKKTPAAEHHLNVRDNMEKLTDEEVITIFLFHTTKI